MPDDPGAQPHPWTTTEPDRVVGKGHPAGDFLEAWKWHVIERDDGHLQVSAHLPMHVRNPRSELFGGFTPTYVDLISLFCVNSRNALAPRSGQFRLATVSMRLDYFEPIVGPTFIIDSMLEHQRGRTHHVLTRLYQDDQLAVLAATTLVEIARP